MTVRARVDMERVREMQENEAFYRPAAEKVNATARDLLRRGVGFGGNRAFISDVAKELGSSTARLAPLLVCWNNLGWVQLARADLVDAMSPDKVRDSEIDVGHGAVHFIDTFDYAAQSKRVRGNPRKKRSDDGWKPTPDMESFFADMRRGSRETWSVRTRAPNGARNEYVGYGSREEAQAFVDNDLPIVKKPGWRYEIVKDNPGTASSRALEKFIEFHDFEPRETGAIPGLKIPSSVKVAGDAVHVMYRSDKWHEGRSDDYIHEHDGGVKVGRTGTCPGPTRSVPAEIQRVTTLVRIGRCLGVAYADADGNVVEMRPDGSVQLYCSPNGRALFVVDGVRVRNGRATFARPRVEMILWGGKLGVEDRGIVH